MDNVRRVEKSETVAISGWPLAQAGSDTARRLYDQGQGVTKAMADWSTEVSGFISHRMSRTSETVGRMTKCQSLPDVFLIQAQWVQDAIDDYRKEANRLMQVNSEIIRGLMESAGKR
jgi:phage gp36-like protein